MLNTRDISYASAGANLAGRSLIRALEVTTGRRSLLKRAKGWDRDLAEGRDFWDMALRRYGLSLQLTGGSFDNLPTEGPLVVIANHPFGILDGLVLGHILERLRGDFRILANAVFKHTEVLDRSLLPIDFSGTREAAEINLASRSTALSLLAKGGAVGVFPGGTVSTAARPFGPALDPSWRNFTAKMISRSGATVVPIYFDGQNSRLFQLASRLSYHLRLGLLLKEFKARTDTPVRLAIGAPIAAEKLAEMRHDPTAMMDFLRRSTYALAPKPLASLGYGYEFEAKYRGRVAEERADGGGNLRLGAGRPDRL